MDKLQTYCLVIPTYHLLSGANNQEQDLRSSTKSLFYTCTQESEQLIVQAKLALDKGQLNSWGAGLRGGCLFWLYNDSKLMMDLTLPSSSAYSSPLPASVFFSASVSHHFHTFHTNNPQTSSLC